MRSVSPSGTSTLSRLEICSGLLAFAHRRSWRRPWRRPLNRTVGPLCRGAVGSGDHTSQAILHGVAPAVVCCLVPAGAPVDVPPGADRPIGSGGHRSHCRPATGTAPRNCHPRIGATVSSMYRDVTTPRATLRDTIVGMTAAAVQRSRKKKASELGIYESRWWCPVP